ncbi:MAG: endonuclease [Weeksellaceae bacterium]|nr:endonuclease [Weeksellaceae bacterium]
MKLISSLLLFFGSILSFAQNIPAYYQGIDFSQGGSHLEQQLTNLMSMTHTVQLSYTPQTWDAIMTTDENPNDPTEVLLVYGYNDSSSNPVSHRTRAKNLNCTGGNCNGLWNREHVYPRSLGGFEEQSWPGSDVHALRSADSNMNEIRVNRPFAIGNGNNAHITPNGSFFPGQEWKGDVARMIMYMHIRYPQQCQASDVAYSNYTYNSQMPDIFLRWNAEDPPSQFEIRRNNILQSIYQGNRNPFIDNPYLATLIWGGPEAQNSWNNLQIAEPEADARSIKLAPNPAIDYVYYAPNNYTSITVWNIAGQLVSEDMDLTDNKTLLPEKPGLYFIKFCYDGQCVSSKAIKK